MPRQRETLETYLCTILGAKKDRRKFQILVIFISNRKTAVRVTLPIHCTAQCNAFGTDAERERFAYKSWDIILYRKKQGITQIHPTSRISKQDQRHYKCDLFINRTYGVEAQPSPKAKTWRIAKAISTSPFRYLLTRRRVSKPYNIPPCMLRGVRRAFGVPAGANMKCPTSPAYKEVELYICNPCVQEALTIIAHTASRSAPIKRDYNPHYPQAN